MGILSSITPCRCDWSMVNGPHSPHIHTENLISLSLYQSAPASRDRNVAYKSPDMRTWMQPDVYQRSCSKDGKTSCLSTILVWHSRPSHNFFQSLVYSCFTDIHKHIGCFYGCQNLLHLSLFPSICGCHTLLHRRIIFPVREMQWYKLTLDQGQCEGEMEGLTFL